MGLSLITAPTLEPLTLDEVRLQCKIDDADTPDNILLAELITAAREWAETLTHRALLTQTWDWTLSNWPAVPFNVPRPPLLSITSIKYLDTTGVQQTLAAATYAVTTHAGPKAAPGVVDLAYGYTWPSLRGVSHQITIRFVAGYGATASTVPGYLRRVMLLHTALHYRYRDVAMPEADREALARMLQPYVVYDGWVTPE